MNINKKSFSLSLKVKLHNEPDTVPEFSVSLNGEPLPVHDNVVIGQAKFGTNTISINFSNKASHHATLAVEIEKFTVEDVDITHNIKSDNVYIVNSGSRERTYGYLHQNGTLTFDFSCPIFYYLRNKSLISDESNS